MGPVQSLWLLLSGTCPAATSRTLSDVAEFRHRAAVPGMDYLGACAVTVPRSSTSSQEGDGVLQGMTKGCPERPDRKAHGASDPPAVFHVCPHQWDYTCFCSDLWSHGPGRARGGSFGSIFPELVQRRSVPTTAVGEALGPCWDPACPAATTRPCSGLLSRQNP